MNDTSPSVLQFYHSPQWLRARFEALKRAGFRCECSGHRPGERLPSGRRCVLEVHHVETLWKRWDLRTTQTNLRVLCQDCHSGVHGRLLSVPRGGYAQMQFDFMNAANVIRIDREECERIAQARGDG